MATARGTAEVEQAVRGAWARRRLLALRVRDGAMADEGLRDGDVLIVDADTAPDAGHTVVAEVDGGITVQRLYRERDGRLRLQPAATDRLPLVLPAERVRVLGPIVGVLRRHGFREARPIRRGGGRERHAVDLTVAAIGESLRRLERRAAESSGRARAMLRALARDLRTLRDCYLETATPRLRHALLLEAADLLDRLREFGVEPAGRASA
jgi:hypothetical protein